MGTAGIAEQRTYRFDGIEVDASRLVVKRMGETIDLEPKAIRVLLHLLENRHRVVRKEELFETVWAGTEVTDNALTRVVGQMRKALGDDARQSRYIETVPTVGYRFCGVLQEEARPDASKRERGRRFLWVWLAAGFAVAAVGIGLFRSQPSSRQPASKLRQITNSKTLDISPAFSPDGRMLAYSSDRAGQFEIFVRSVDGSGRELQITSDGGGSVESDWSPDGRTIAFHCMSRGGICLTPALGGPIRQITTFGSQPSWSPDGKTIAFRSMRMISPSPYDTVTSFPSEVWAVNAESGALRKLSQSVESYTSPSFTPDGRWVMAIVTADRKSEVRAIPVAGGTEHVVYSSAARGLFAPQLSPDGRTLYFSVFVKADSNVIYSLPVDANLVAQGNPAAIQVTPEKIQFLRLRKDGRALAMSQVRVDSNLWRVNARDAAAPPQPVTANTNERNTVPAFSPDGEWLAYHTRRFGESAEAWRIRVDGRDAELLHAAANGSFGPQWLPDGRGLLILTPPRVVRFSLDDRMARPVDLPIPEGVDRSPFGFPRLGMDGHSAFVNGKVGANLRVGVMDWRSGALRWITPASKSIGFPSVSPDGRRVAAELLSDYSSHVTVFSADGGEVRILTSGLEQAWPYSWSPDSKRIAFAGQRAGVWNIWSLDPATGEQKRLTDYRSARAFVRYPAWSPRGDAIAFELTEVRGNIFTLELPR